PGRRHAERVARRPVALDQTGVDVGDARRLRRARQRADALHQAAAEALVIAHAIDIDRVRRRAGHAHVEGDRIALVDARRGRVALDLLADIVGRRAAYPQ